MPPPPPPNTHMHARALPRNTSLSRPPTPPRPNPLRASYFAGGTHTVFVPFGWQARCGVHLKNLLANVHGQCVVGGGSYVWPVPGHKLSGHLETFPVVNFKCFQALLAEDIGHVSWFLHWGSGLGAPGARVLLRVAARACPQGRAAAAAARSAQARPTCTPLSDALNPPLLPPARRARARSPSPPTTSCTSSFSNWTWIARDIWMARRCVPCQGKAHWLGCGEVLWDWPKPLSTAARAPCASRGGRGARHGSLFSP